jgi:hypothetical protein
MALATSSGKYLKRTASLPSYNNYSACGWFKRTTDNNNYSTLCMVEDGGYSGAGLCYNSNGDDVVATDPDGFSSTIITPGTAWFFWAFVAKASSVVGYAAVATAASISTQTRAANASQTPDAFCVGDISSGYPGTGNFAAVKVWDAQLTAAEIEAERWSYMPRRLANLHLWTPLIGSSAANCAIDWSGNGKNWTVVSTPTVIDGPPIPWRGSRWR